LEETRPVQKTHGPRRSSGLPLRRILIGAAVLIGLVAAARLGGGYVETFRAQVEGLGVWGPVVFILGYALAVVAFVPASVLTLAAGAIFGIAAGTVYVFFAATLGAAAAFLVSRYLARASIERRIESDARFAAMDRAVGEQGLRIVALMRLSPVFPFNLLNYALGLTRVGFVDYNIASLGMLPGTLAYVYLGSVAGEVASLAGGAEMARGPVDYAIWGVGLVATFAVTVIVGRIARRALSEATEV
jgi:uncharacterized membrane protein YdjX (TVP38/TMEM64 family)